MIVGGKQPTKKLIEVAQESRRKLGSHGHFDVVDLVLLKGVFEAIPPRT
jgi:hypothetical protein